MIDRTRKALIHLLDGRITFGDSSRSAVRALLADIERLEAERTVDAQAFASPAARIANLEHELADLRESETTQATRIDSLELRLKVADAEIASLRLLVEAWTTVATGIKQ